MKTIDLRCDTLTTQSPEMIQAACCINPGDDVYEEDASTKELESYAKQLCCMEDALFVASGTMGNLLAVLCHAGRGGEIILGSSSHIYNLEASGASALGGISYRPVEEKDGMPDIEDIESAIREDDIYSPKTELICLENTHNLLGGLAVPPAKIEAISQLAKTHDIPVHLDGARIFNACALYDVEVEAYAKHVDTMMFCLAKGLGAPVGAILTGSKAFIAKARKFRKMLGGGMRQPGYITAMGLMALKNNRAVLPFDNARAAGIAKRLDKLQQFDVVESEFMTNIVYIWLTDKSIDATEYLPKLEKKGIKMLGNKRGFRVVLYKDIDDDDVNRFCDVMEELFS